ncbi:MAG: hypothetical protein K2X37_01475, partial [Chitinophagaceae bacterium]|nr:hypothetical protein [Chitinophagaceae bacterium]
MGGIIMINITPESAALALVSKQIKSGYVWEVLHDYKDLSGNTLFWRIRLKHANGDKWIRPMYKGNDGKYLLKEPPYLRDSLKPLYNQHLLIDFSNATLVIVEGELKADILNAFFIRHNAGDKFIAITSGSATSATNADWQPVHSRKCLIWPDNDAPGFNYATVVYEKLSLINCQAEIVDVTTLNLKSGGDCADWVNDNPSYTLDNFLCISKQETLEEVGEASAIKGSSQASELVAFILEQAVLCHDKNKNVYAIDKQTNEVRQIDS